MSKANLALTPPRGSRDEIQEWMVERTLGACDRGVSSVLGIAATGTGKTRTGMKVAARWMDEVDSRPVAWWTHLDTLINQTKLAMEDFGFVVGVEQGTSHAYRALRGQTSFLGKPDVVILSVKSMKEDRLRNYRPDDFGAHFVDEAHLSTADTWSRPISYFRPRLWKMITATPITSSGEPLVGCEGAPCEEVVYNYSLADAISYGHLPPIRSYVHDLGIDPKGISTRGKSDIPESELEQQILLRMEPIVQKCASEIRRLGCRKVLAFLPTVRSSVIFADALSNLGVPSKAVYGQQSKSISPQARAPFLPECERDRRIKDHKEFGYPVLANSQYLEIGYDDPSIEMILMLTATNSIVKLFQRVGRGTRPSPETGKGFLHLFSISWGIQGAVSSIDLLLVDETDPRVREKARKLAGKKKYQGKTLDEILDDAREEVEVEKASEEELALLREAEASDRSSRSKLSRRDVKCRTTVSEPFGFGDLLGVDLGTVNRSLATMEQRTALHAYGFKGIAHLTSSEAREKIDAYEAHLARGGATKKQQDWVRRVHKWMPENKIQELTNQDVRRMMAKVFSGRR